MIGKVELEEDIPSYREGEDIPDVDEEPEEEFEGEDDDEDEDEE